MDKHTSSSFQDQESLVEQSVRGRKNLVQWWFAQSRTFRVASALILTAALTGIIVGVSVRAHSHGAALQNPVLAMAPLSSDASSAVLSASAVISGSAVSQVIAATPVSVVDPASTPSPVSTINSVVQACQVKTAGRANVVDPASVVSPTNPASPDSSIGADAAGNADTRLRFTSGGTFQITVFNDLHFGEGEANPPEMGWGPISDVKTTGVMNKILDSESSSQLVVLNGDMITGDSLHLENSTNYLDRIVEPLVQRNLLWASTYGNHDMGFNLSTQQLLKREMTYPNSLTKDMIGNSDAGTSNYYLPVYGSQGGSVPELLLWFFDSMGGSAYQQHSDTGGTVGVEGVVHDAVTQWFCLTQQALKSHYGRVVPSLAFVHIPIYAMASFQKTGVDPNKEPGINGDTRLEPQGVWNDDYTGSDIPFMSALLNTQGLLAVFSGHDHGNDWCNKWDRQYRDMSLAGNGLFLCFGRHSGYGGYGSWMRGSRQILLQESTLDKEIHTWVRLEDQSISGDVLLNATYGQDGYRAVEDRNSK